MHSSPQPFPGDPCLLSAARTEALRFEHLSTEVKNPANLEAVLGSFGHCPCGSTHWRARVPPDDSVTALMWWDWVEINPGVVVLANAMDLHTNIQLVHEPGSTASPLEMVRMLNRLVHGLQWQEVVQSTMKKGQPDQATPRLALSPARWIENAMAASDASGAEPPGLPTRGGKPPTEAQDTGAAAPVPHSGAVNESDSLDTDDDTDFGGLDSRMRTQY